jgi:polysaccharide transporter, PST family
MKKMAINMASLFISVVANRIFPILLFPFLARALGPESFGRYVQASAFSYLLAQLVEWGFNMTGVREVAHVATDPEKVGRIITTIALSRALIASVIFLACAMASPWLTRLAPDSAVFWSALIYGVLYAFDFRFAFYGLQETRPFLILSFVQYLASFVIIVLFVRSPADTWLALAAPALCSVASTLLSLTLLRKRAHFSRPSLKSALSGIRGSVHVFLSRNVFQTSSQLGVLILGFFAAPQMVGWLGVSERITRTIGGLILYPLQIGVAPAILERSVHDRRRAVMIYLCSLAMAAGSAALAGVALFLYAPLLLTLFLGSASSEAIQTLKLLSFYPLVFVFIHQGGIFWLYLLHWDRENFIILLTYTAIFALLLVALAYTWQLRGVSVGILLCGVGLVLTYAVFFTRKGIQPWRRPLGEALGSSRLKKSHE